MRITEVKFDPSIISRYPKNFTKEEQIYVFSPSIPDETWQAIKADFEKSSITHSITEENKSITIQSECSNIQCMQLASIFAKHDAMAYQDLVKMRRDFIKTNCLHFTQLMKDNEHFEALSPLFQKFKKNDFSPSTLTQIPEFLKTLEKVENNPHISKDKSFQTHYPFVKKFLQKEYNHFQYVHTAKDKLFLQTFSRTMNPGQIGQMEEGELRTGLSPTLRKLPDDHAFKIIDLLNPRFPDTRVSGELRKMYIKNRNLDYTPEKKMDFRTLVSDSVNKRNSTNVLL